MRRRCPLKRRPSVESLRPSIGRAFVVRSFSEIALCFSVTAVQKRRVKKRQDQVLTCATGRTQDLTPSVHSSERHKSRPDPILADQPRLIRAVTDQRQQVAGG